jgi:hypothetical protein
VVFHAFRHEGNDLTSTDVQAPASCVADGIAAIRGAA